MLSMRLYKFTDNNSRFYVITKKPIIKSEEDILRSIINACDNKEPVDVIEYGPYPSLESVWGTNAKNICHKSGLKNIVRIEKTILTPVKYFNNDMIDNMTECIYDNVQIDDFINIDYDNSDSLIDYSYKTKEDIRDTIISLNNIHNFGFDNQDMDYYVSVFHKLNRVPSLIELYDISQSNSEHSRHWFFGGKLLYNGCTLPSLFSMIKNTQTVNNNSLIAFSDNSSAIRGYDIMVIIPDIKYKECSRRYHLTFTAETHNFPTGIAPFQGATTGTGGRIRDQNSTGRGSLVIAGTVGYCVGNMDNGKYKDKNKRTLLLASDGASDYGNKFGEPVINGFCRTFGKNINNERIEWVKPIMFSGGIGQIDDNHLYKKKPTDGDKIVKIGGPAYKIGIGGGSASSRGQDELNINNDLNSVQRGDPEMENKMNRVVRRCVEMGNNNPILSIHDQGAGGTGNVTKEIMDNVGGCVFLNNISKGDKSMDNLSLWISEYQESDTLLIKEEDINILKGICERENVNIDVIGTIRDTGNARVYDINKEILVDLPLKPIVNPTYKKTYILEKNDINLSYEKITDYPIIDMIQKIFYNTSVSSKRFLTNKVDRSVTGLVAQQQCVGPLHTPLSDYGIIAQSHFGITGGMTANGERPIMGLVNTEIMARTAVGEMLTNMMFAKISKLEDIKCSGNWMWPANFKGERYNMYMATKSMCNMMKTLGIALDGGKDSLSMSYTDKNKVIKCPGSLVISGYAPVPDITRKITPDFKYKDNDIIYIDLSVVTDRGYDMGCSILYQEYDILNTHVPDVNVNILKKTFNKIQKLLGEDDIIISGHDRSDGGLITTICEMCFAGNKGCNLTINEKDPIGFLFNEGLGLVIESNWNYTNFLLATFSGYSYYLGKITDDDKICILNNNHIILDKKMTELRIMWEQRSIELEIEQCNNICINEEILTYREMSSPNYISPKIALNKCINMRYNVAIIREEGSNGDREMASAFYMCGFNVYDVCMNDLIADKYDNFDIFRGIVFVGGFSYADVLGSANGWYNVIKNNKKIWDILYNFRKRDDTFVLGVCNGCQLLCKLGWVDGKLTYNTSNRFESRYSTVKIKETDNIFLKNMEDSVLGIWVAHGEGRFVYGNPVITYVDNKNNDTQKYPYNPNNSINACAGLSSDDGRCLAIMPHPERTFLKWQLPYINKSIDDYDDIFSPWIMLFKNAYDWCNINQIY